MRHVAIMAGVAWLCACGGSSTGNANGSGGHAGGRLQASGGSGGSASATGGGAGAGDTRGGGGTSVTSAASGGAAEPSGGAGGGAASGGAASTPTGGTAVASQASGGASGGTRATGGVAGGATGTSQAQGGAAGTPSTDDPNVVPIIVDQGAGSSPYVNGPFATATICEPGTSNCQTINHLLIDTGSVGLRVLESVLTLKLPAATSAAGKNLAECTPFVSGTSWGPVRVADLKVGGETASNLRIQAIGEATYKLAASCSGVPINDVDALSSNGILGVGLYTEDCGAGCARQNGNPGVYYECTAAGSCTVATVPAASQVANPIVAFSVDNNGSFIQLPSVAPAGAPSVSGFLVFGIGTRSNNGLGSAKVIPADQVGFVTTTFPAGGTSYKSFLDSGSNGIFFLNSTVSKIALCSGNASAFYCPQSTTNLTAAIPSNDGSAAAISFSVANASRLSAANVAFSNLAGPMPGYPTDPTMPGFDWGLSFYYGRTVFTAIEGRSTPGGSGPYFAF